jgi:tyrosinase
MDPGLSIPSNPRADGYGSNPRCHRRDVNNFFTSTYMTPAALLQQLTSSPDIQTFQTTLQIGVTTPLTALHTGGHFSIWGDPGGDVFVSPNEPAFWLHHAQLDRHWWMWTNYVGKEVAKRTAQYEGGTNWLDMNSPKGKSTDKQWLSVVAPKGMDGIAAKELFSTTAGPFCYIYQ